MSYAFPDQLQQLVNLQMHQGGYVSEDELLLDAMQTLANTKQRCEQLRTEIRSRIETANLGLSLPLDLAEFKAQARKGLATQE
jgi:Arc/MetJ-type ribon-helix-helix transcriptional regulator